jgi:hypothetical protein
MLGRVDAVLLEPLARAHGREPSLLLVLLALNLRRALVDRPYRARALWTAVGSLAVVSLIMAGVVDSIFGQVPNNLTAVVVEGAIWGFTFLGLFGWMVTNANVAIAADYFNRDALWWKRGGKVVSPVLLVVAYIFASLPPWWFPSGASADFAGTVANLVITAIFVGSAFYAAAVLAITYRRINDLRVKNYTKWVVVSILSVLTLLFTPEYLTIVVAIIWVFAMYRSIQSLAIKVKSLPS